MKLSVALCTYNGEKFLEEQLKSILNQTLNVDEIVICDDNSTDNTVDIALQFQRKYPEIIFIEQNKINLGTIKNFEKAISLTSGDFIFISDQDDIWLPNKVFEMIDFFNRNDTCLLLFSNGDLIDELGNSLNSTLWDKWGFTNELKIKWTDNSLAMCDLINNINKVTGATCCITSKLKSDILPINTPPNFWHDTWIAMHAAYKNGLFFLDVTTIQYRVHENQQIGIEIISSVLDKSNITIVDFRKYIKKKFPEYNRKLKIETYKNNLIQKLKRKFFNFTKKMIP